MPLKRMLSTSSLSLGLALGLALGGLGAVGLSGPALAQQGGAPAEGAPPGGSGDAVASQGAADFAEDELRAFIRAALAVSELERAYVAEIQAAGTEQEREAIVVEANDAMRSAIEDQEGIDVARYVEIGQAAQADPDLNATLMAMLEEMQAE